MSAPANPFLILQQVGDPYVRKNFQSLAEYFGTQNQLLDFKFFEQVFTKAQKGFKLAHGLSYIPLDILVTRISGPGTVTFQYGQFDLSNLVMDVTDACRLRFYAGTYSQLQSQVQTQATDTAQIFANPATQTKPVYTSVSVPVPTAQLTQYPGSSSGIYTVRAALDDVILVSGALAKQKIILAPAASFAGRFLWVIRTDAGSAAVTVAPSLGGSINGSSASITLSGAYSKACLFSNGVTYVRLV